MGSETFNAGRAHTMTIAYCGGWGYRPRCMETIGKIEENLPGQFTIIITSDPKRSGRFECVIGEELVHSKA